MIIIITLAALMLAASLVACFKPCKYENIVIYDYTKPNPIDELRAYLETEKRK